MHPVVSVAFREKHIVISNGYISPVHNVAPMLNINVLVNVLFLLFVRKEVLQKE